MPMAPWPTAGSISSVERIEVALPARPRRFSPASARIVASASPAASLASRVPTLPRSVVTVRSGRRARIWA